MDKWATKLDQTPLPDPKLDQTPLPDPVFAKFLADRVARLSGLRQHGHNTIEQCLPIPIAIPTPITLRPPVDRVAQVIGEPFLGYLKRLPINKLQI